VLVLYSDERLLPASMIVGETILATFAADASKRIEFHSEFLDVQAQQRGIFSGISVTIPSSSRNSPSKNVLGT
jgi:hypothetical protein